MIREAVDRFIAHREEGDRNTLLRSAFGVWRDREDLADLDRLVDMDVLVDYLRRHCLAAKFLENCPGAIMVSVITVAELFAGSRGTEERAALGSFLEAFTVVPVDRDIAAAGGLLRGRFGPSHGTGLADALIAATANQHDSILVTLNRKRYPAVSKCEVPYAKAR